ncbi:MAG: MogA/MoaB family molybdenum cofactor biosynthesis protein [Thermoproteota archaeon]|nr:MogA/MoaB family molybdenum cofactor biosynthesis protein [Candidatus Brockarchaeota archaeon]
MSYLKHKEAAPKNLGFAIVTISDSRTLETDESGNIAFKILISNGYDVIERVLIPNDADRIRKKIRDLVKDKRVDVVITIGGTGLSKRDLTVETVSKIVEKKINGFGELFRAISYSEIGVSAMLSRAFGGVASGKIILCLPGSQNAVELAIRKLVIPEIRHMIREARR